MKKLKMKTMRCDAALDVWELSGDVPLEFACNQVSRLQEIGAVA
jgi:hypothetical protein